MVGGIVVDVWRWETDHVGVVVQEGRDYMAVDLVKNDDSLCIIRGDKLWWQSGFAMWTPKDHSLSDVRIPRLGYSYSVKGPNHPDRNKED